MKWMKDKHFENSRNSHYISEDGRWKIRQGGNGKSRCGNSYAGWYLRDTKNEYTHGSEISFERLKDAKYWVEETMAAEYYGGLD